MLLYRTTHTRHRVEGSLVTSKNYVFTTLAHERQVADEFAASYGYRQGDGHIAIVDEDGIGINKLEFQP